MYSFRTMMGKRIVARKSDVLSASEIGQFVFCSCAWQLRRMGYEPESPFLGPGKQAHVALGETMDGLERKIRFSRWCAMIGVVVLCVVLLFFLLEVML
jgi:hypothetical protein